MESYSKKIDRRSSKKLVEKHVDKKVNDLFGQVIIFIC